MWRHFAPSRPRTLADAAKASWLHSYSLTAVGDGVSCSAHTDTGHTVRSDLPRLAGGHDSAAQPVELLLSALVGCKTATAHFVARHLWRRPGNQISSLRFAEVRAERDERGALALPITAPPPVSSAVQRVSGVVFVRPASAEVDGDDVRVLGLLVEERCPVAATLRAAGVALDFEWRMEQQPRLSLAEAET
jgi:uncharacterized OsmC-like protein